MKDTVFFIKMQGCGNDFVIVDNRNNDQTIKQELIARLADRHFGVGCDQFIVIGNSDLATAKMTIYNNDGSIAETCGNATRCVARILFSENSKLSELVLESGVRLLKVFKLENETYKVHMGEPTLEGSMIPVNAALGENNSLPLEFMGQKAIAVGMGNPHAVFFLDDIDHIDIEKYGSEFENHTIFPDKANISFAQVVNKNTIRLRVWERGAGETMACGSGACAALVAARLKGLIDNEASIEMKGGELIISQDEAGNVYMTGPARETFIGKFSWNMLM